MVHYKLTYFNARGRAEIIRLIFAVAEVEYEDVRIEKDKWPELKNSTPFGQIPILEIDGKTFCQSYAVGRYLARKFNLTGKTDLDQLQGDMIIDCLEDGAKPFLRYMFEADEARKAEMKKKFTEEELPATCASLEKILKSNNGGDGFFIEDNKVGGNEAVLEKYPKLTALAKRVESAPKVAAWIAKRPVTDF